MSKSRIFLSSPHLSGHEMPFIEEAFDNNWISPLGPNVDGFETDLCAYTGAQHAAALSSGTAAIHLALILLGVTRGDEVLCSSFTFSASANPIVYQGATPMFVESEEETWNIDPVTLESAIKDRIATGKTPKALVLVHLYGMPARLDDIMNICERYDVPIIEDAAEALGSTYKGQALGTFGELGVLSFNGNKIITTSGGGALLSAKQEHIEKVRFLATQARDDAPHYQHSHIGYNYRMSNIAAGIGRGQMQVIEKRVAARRANFERYERFFADVPGIKTAPKEPANAYSNRWLSTILIDEDAALDREALRLHLQAANIEARPLWKPMHLQPVFKDAPYYYNKNQGDRTSERLFERGLCLPSGSNLSEEEWERIERCLSKALS